MRIAEALALLLSAIATFTALRANWRSDRTANEQKELRRRLLAIENAQERDWRREAVRAEVRAAVENGQRGDARLVVTNHGAGEARQVTLTVEREPADSKHLFDGERPIPVLAPGASAAFQVFLTAATPLHFRGGLCWEDGSGERRQ